MNRDCEWCGNPLPDDARWNTKYHTACSLEVRIVRNRNNALARMHLLRYTSTLKPRDPMKNLGLDYVTLALAGKIKIPRAARQQLHLKGSKNEDDRRS